ncbi:hypothetical protein niasHS_002132 [Heterodera schachtii]|uniref:C3H1-type domain-containing protein n=1 Tax=Heterodera schachtii TaxID=97005 RepID=A0ABD2KMC4_HETSC
MIKFDDAPGSSAAAASSAGNAASAVGTPSVVPPTSAAAAALTLAALNAGVAVAASTSGGAGAIPSSVGGNTASLALQQQQQQQQQQLTQLLTGKDSRWLQLEVCREFQRGQCSRSEHDCKYAHPPSYVEVQNGRVIACYDSIKVVGRKWRGLPNERKGIANDGRCTRENPKCKYLHPPQHLKDQLLATGKQNLVMKNLVAQQFGHQQQPSALPTIAQLVQPGVTSLAALQSAATALPLPFFTTAAALPAGLFPAGTAAFLPQIEQHFGALQTTSSPSASVSVPSAAMQQQLAVAQQLALLQQQNAPAAAALLGTGGGGGQSSAAAAAAALLLAQQQAAAAVQAAQQSQHQQQQQQQQQQQILLHLAIQHHQQQQAVAAAMFAAQQRQSSSPTSTDGGAGQLQEQQMGGSGASTGGGRKRNARAAGLEHHHQHKQHNHHLQQQQQQMPADGAADGAALDPVHHQLQLQLAAAAAAANANGAGAGGAFLSAAVTKHRSALDKAASLNGSANGNGTFAVTSSAIASAGGVPLYATPAQFNPYLVPASFLPAGAVSFAAQLPPRFG